MTADQSPKSSKRRLDADIHTNIVVLRGNLGEVRERETILSGVVSETLLRTVSVVADQRIRDDVPLVWTGDATVFGSIETGREVVVSGRVRQRFFRTGGATVSRTEVVVEALVPVAQRAASRRLTERAAMRASALPMLLS